MTTTARATSGGSGELVAPLAGEPSVTLDNGIA